ncbi:MAG: hypothetical protein MUF48_05880 [Pirellulaceae bacterium]|nr:hypothetical protein [Pirellulaceae bacterium]
MSDRCLKSPQRPQHAGETCPAVPPIRGAPPGGGRGRLLRAGAAATLSWLLVVLTPAALVAEPPSIAEIRLGLGGKFKVGCWTPVRITLHGGAADFSGRLELVAPDSDELSTRFTDAAEATLQVPAGGQWTGWRYIKLGKIRGRVRVLLRSADGQVVRESVADDAVAQPATWQWVVNTGPDVGIEQATGLLARLRGEKLLTSTVRDPAEFPDRWFGYEGVDVLVVPTATTNPLEQLSEPQFAAILQWLRLGGRLLVSAGRRAPELFRAEHRFDILRPGTFVELDEYWKASGLEHFARAAERLTADGEASLAVFSDWRGTVLCYEGVGGPNDRGLVARHAVGFGDVTSVALDLEQGPVAQWPARARLLARLLQTRSDEEESAMASEGLGQVTHFGYDDIAGQLRAALDRYSRVTLVRFSWIAAILVLYLLLLGPLDFFGLHRLRRLQWTWFTFPVIVLAFCLLAAGLSRHWQGNRLELNCLDIVDVDATDGLLRGTSWANVYSPRAERLDLDLDVQPAVAMGSRPGVLLGWNGLPGTGLGGMNTATSVEVLRDEYQIVLTAADGSPAHTAIAGLPLQPSASRSLTARWWAHTRASLAASELQVTETGLLRGLIVNPLDVELVQSYLYFGDWAFPIEGRWGPGDRLDVAALTPLDLRWHLTRRRIIEAVDVTTPWDRADLSDPARVADMLMFYGVAGGRAYTRLSHRYQAHVDLSRHLRGGRAILVGRSKTPATVLRRGGASLAEHVDRQWTIYRVSIPVSGDQRRDWGELKGERVESRE